MECRLPRLLSIWSRQATKQRREVVGGCARCAQFLGRRRFSGGGLLHLSRPRDAGFALRAAASLWLQRGPGATGPLDRVHPFRVGRILFRAPAARAGLSGATRRSRIGPHCRPSRVRRALAPRVGAAYPPEPSLRAYSEAGACPVGEEGRVRPGCMRRFGRLLNLTAVRTLRP